MVEKITLMCFGASYVVALALELWHLVRRRPVLRLLGIGFGAAGLLAHTLFLLGQNPDLSSQFGSLVFLAWILAVFYLYGSIHHRQVAWGVFVLPLVCALVGLAWASSRLPLTADADEGYTPIWRGVHAVLLVLAAVGVCVGFLASVMYLTQVRRLRVKSVPGQGLRLLSLERLEAMNRRAVNLAFPFLTAGLLIGFILNANPERQVPWTDPKLLASLVLWLVFAVLLYLRYAQHVRGRRMAVLTIVAFTLLLFTMAWPHLGEK